MERASELHSGGFGATVGVHEADNGNARHPSTQFAPRFAASGDGPIVAPPHLHAREWGPCKKSEHEGQGRGFDPVFDPISPVSRGGRGRIL